MRGWRGASRTPWWSCTAEGMSSAGTGLVRTKLASIGLSRLVLFLDFDGTLVPIATRPEKVELNETVRRGLERLARRIPVVLVSGRSVDDLRRIVGLRHLHYIGLHGFSYAEPGKPPSWLAARPSRRIVCKWKQALEVVAGNIDGAWVEDKGISVALHDRQVAPQDRRRLRRQTIKALWEWLYEEQIRLLAGKHVMEVLPATHCDKGTAVSWLLHEHWARSRIPVYLGDDVTDIPALELVGRSGVAIQVGSIPHAPRTCLRLANSTVVEDLLHDLANRLNHLGSRSLRAPGRRGSRPFK